jgi:hypothetical protein
VGRGAADKLHRDSIVFHPHLAVQIHSQPCLCLERDRALCNAQRVCFWCCSGGEAKCSSDPWAGHNAWNMTMSAVTAEIQTSAHAARCRASGHRLTASTASEISI